MKQKDKERIKANEVKLEQQSNGEYIIKHKRLRGRWSAGVMATEFEVCLWTHLQRCKAECAALKTELEKQKREQEGQNDRDRKAEQENKMPEETA